MKFPAIASRHSSLNRASPPNSIRARRSASARPNPKRSRSSARSWMCERNSSSKIVLGLRTMKKSRSQGSKICGNHSSLDIRHLVIPSSFDIRASSFTSYFLRLRGEGRGNGRDQAVPSIGFLAKTLAPLRREFVKLRAPVVFRFAPLGFQKSLPHQAKEGGVKRSLLDEQGIA